MPERPSPLQNRVLPTGEIVAHSGRGLLMGNRGCIHQPDGRLGTSRWRSKLWIACVLEWRGWRRDPMPPGRWTALFFLDEVTSLAAGHRPCAYCRRADYRSFTEHWRIAAGLAERPKATFMDSVLHAERVDSRTRRKLTRPARVADLPDGVLVHRDDAGDPMLLSRGNLLPWSFSGYGAPQPVSGNMTVHLLTPPSTAAVLAAGYRPMIHPSAL